MHSAVVAAAKDPQVRAAAQTRLTREQAGAEVRTFLEGGLAQVAMALRLCADMELLPLLLPSLPLPHSALQAAHAALDAFAAAVPSVQYYVCAQRDTRLLCVAALVVQAASSVEGTSVGKVAKRAVRDDLRWSASDTSAVSVVGRAACIFAEAIATNGEAASGRTKKTLLADAVSTSGTLWPLGVALGCTRFPEPRKIAKHTTAHVYDLGLQDWWRTPLPLNGRQVMERAGVGSGPCVGILLARLRQWQLEHLPLPCPLPPDEWFASAFVGAS